MHRRAWGRAYCYQSHCRIHAQESLGKSLLLSITLQDTCTVHLKFSKSVLSVHNRHTLNKPNHMRRLSTVRNPFTQMHTTLHRLGLNEADDSFLFFLHEYIQNYTVFVLYSKSLGYEATFQVQLSFVPGTT